MEQPGDRYPRHGDELKTDEADGEIGSQGRTDEVDPLIRVDAFYKRRTE